VPEVRRDDSGATAVEFALVVPIFFGLVAITGYFAWLVFASSQVERAAQRAARYAAVPTTEGTYTFDQCDVVAEVNDELSAFTVAPSSVEVRDASGALATVATCPGGAAPARPRGYVRVRVVHRLDNPFTDLLKLLLGGNNAATVSGSGEARVEDPL
jgi:Flp pilus assembly protein TadG